MTDAEVKVMVMRYSNLLKDALEVYETKFNEMFIRAKDGTAYLYDPLEGFVRKLPRDSSDMTYAETLEEMGKRIKSRIRHVGMTQDEVARRVGITPQSLSRYITGSSAPSIVILDRIARVLKCRVDDFLYYD